MKNLKIMQKKKREGRLERINVWSAVIGLGIYYLEIYLLYFEVWGYEEKMHRNIPNNSKYSKYYIQMSVIVVGIQWNVAKSPSKC